jgi:Clustered mitochondria
MKPALYDIKKSRLQLKRARDMIAYPPLVKGAIVDATNKNDEEVDASAKQSGAEKSKDVCTMVQIRAKLPKAEEIFASATLEGFFTQTMLRAGSPETTKAASASKTPSECVKSLSASGWNPPPPPRRAQGDLFYIEAVTEEAVLHITCCPSGFYVNKSTRYFFDPTPAANAHFSHELFFTLLGSSLSLRTAWHAVCTVAPKVNPSKPLETTTGALDVVSTLYSQGREDQIFLRPQWTVPPVGPGGARVGDAEVSVKGAKHSFDISRLHDDLGDQFGAEDPGAPREWNEEMQSIRSLATKEIADKVMKAKFIHKFYYEFAEAVKAGAVAIFEGHIAPINPMDSEKTQVYVYNNIFYSRAVDTKENFKICQGDEANRKLAGHDIKNQRLIQAVGVDGLCTVLSCVVDFKGERMVGQTIIPGVLQTGVHSARLLYGALEIGKRMTVKTEGLALMEALFSKLYIAKRNIAAIPVVTISSAQPTDEDIEAENAAKAAQNGISGLFGSLEEAQDQVIKTL